jgi:dipeptidyl aminopeptidase/acylaminoacyl peptidase
MPNATFLPVRSVPAACALLALAAACGGEPTTPPAAAPTTLHFTLDPAVGAFTPCGSEVPVTVHVTDGGGNPVAGVLVNFHTTAGGGSLFAGSGVSSASGTVKDYWTVGTAPDFVNRLEARAVDPVTGVKQVYAADSVTTLTRIAFTSTRDGNWEIYSMRPDGSGPLRLTNSPGSDLAPVWSRDFTRLAFLSNRDGNYEIYSMNADGTNLQRLTNTAADEADPAWSPDGGKIAFSSRRDGNWEIYQMNADGTAQTRLTIEAAYDGQPAWGLSPAFPTPQPQLVYVTARYGNNEIVTLNGSAATQRVTNNPADDHDPEFSPDSYTLAFTSTRDGNPEIYTTARITTGVGGWAAPVRVTNDAARDEGPAWSPDGSKLVFGTTRHDGKGEVYTAFRDGTGLRRLTANASWDFTPAWSACVAQ